MTDNNILLQHDDQGVRTLTLNRPDTLNALNTDLLRALTKAMQAAERDAGVQCVVLTGAGRAFCSGQDLADIRSWYDGDEQPALGDHLRQNYNPLILKMRSIEKPIVAAVNGAAAGAGASLAFACDLRIVSADAYFAQSFVHVGLVPDSGGTFFLPQLVGAARAFELAATGRKVKAEEAAQIGLVNTVVAAEELQNAAATLGARLAGMPAKAIALTKRAIRASSAHNLAQHLDYESMLQTTAGASADHREGVMAFLEKRKPIWQHQR